MTLGFSTKIKDKFTRFPEKIWQSLMQDLGVTDEIYYKWHGEDGILNYNMGNTYDDGLFDINPKKHTIRKDEKGRWKVGNDIHFVIGNRTKQRFQFAPKVKVKSIQKIKIVYEFPNNPDFNPCVFVDDELLDVDELYQLSINDGFDSIDAFFWMV